MPERRGTLRIPLEDRVTLRYPRGQRTYRGRIENISKEGILVSSETAFPPGVRLIFEVVPSEDHPNPTPLRGIFQVHRAEGLEPPFQIAGILIERGARGAG